jgi:dTMP kinase
VRGLLIALEGPEGSGKSTQAGLLADRLGAVLTREPGGTALGEQIRSLLLDPSLSSLDPRAEALLLAADRAQHVATLVRPALEAGRHVVSDRFSPSSLAYQGLGRGLDVEELRRLSAWASGDLWPDLVVLVDVPPEVAQARVEGADRFEREDPAFHRRVAEGYRRLAGDDPGRWRVVDGVGTVEEVAARVWSAIQGALAEA